MVKTQRSASARSFAQKSRRVFGHICRAKCGLSLSERSSISDHQRSLKRSIQRSLHDLVGRASTSAESTTLPAPGGPSPRTGATCSRLCRRPDCGRRIESDTHGVVPDRASTQGRRPPRPQRLRDGQDPPERAAAAPRVPAERLAASRRGGGLRAHVARGPSGGRPPRRARPRRPWRARHAHVPGGDPGPLPDRSSSVLHTQSPCGSRGTGHWR